MVRVAAWVEERLISLLTDFHLDGLQYTVRCCCGGTMISIIIIQFFVVVCGFSSFFFVLFNNNSTIILFLCWFVMITISFLLLIDLVI